MNLFSRIGFWLRDIFSADQGKRLEQSPDQVKREVMAEYDKHLADINRAMVHLVFERKNLEQSLRDTKGKRVMLEEDLKTCLYEDKDELAEQILEQLDQAKSEEQFYMSQLDTIRIELEKAKEADKEMRQQAQKARHQMNFLIGKQKVLRVRKQLLKRLDNTTSQIEKKWPLINQIEDKIRHLEAETEVQESMKPQEHEELKKMREKRKQNEYSGRVQILKRELLQKPLPPAKASLLVN